MKILLVRDRNVLNTNWLVLYANLLAERGYEIVIATDTYAKLGKLSVGMTLHPSIRLINLNAPTHSKLQNVWRRWREKLPFRSRRFYHVILSEKPDVIVCYFPTDLFNVVRWKRPQIPLIQMVHGHPDIVFGKYLFKPWRRWRARQAFKCVTVFQALLPSYISAVKSFFPNQRCVSIANPVAQIPAEQAVDLSCEKKKIIYVARVEKNIKRQHVLVEAFGRVARDFPGWILELWGLQKYPAYDVELKKIATAHGVSERVFLKGYSRDIGSVYRSADIHGFPSANEGFSLAFADGMAYGLPSLGFRDTPSVNELIVDGQNGFLADDLDDFTELLRQLMSDQTLRRRMGAQARQDMKAYAPNLLVDQWEELFHSLVAKDK